MWRGPSAHVSVAAHLIVGAREEPFLPALLESLVGVVERVLVNDNSGEARSSNLDVLLASPFARAGMLEVDTTPWHDFATARNAVLALHARIDAGAWAAFVDADDVHRPMARTIASRLSILPARIAVVDAYTRHHLQSFRWYTSIERRMAFFRFSPDLHWSGTVHERLDGIEGERLALPYVYDHYGWVLPAARQMAKGRQYASLGQAGETIDEAREADTDERAYFAPLWPLALRMRDEHPPAVAAIRSTMEALDAARFARTDAAIAAFQPIPTRLRNIARRLNFAYRWRGRIIAPMARALMRKDQV